MNIFKKFKPVKSTPENMLTSPAVPESNNVYKKNIKRILGVLYAITFIAILFFGLNYVKKTKTTTETVPSSITETPNTPRGENPIPSPEYASDYSSDKPQTLVQLGIRTFPTFPESEKAYEIKDESYS